MSYWDSDIGVGIVFPNLTTNMVSIVQKEEYEELTPAKETLGKNT